MKKINLKGVSETLNERELKNVRGGNVFEMNRREEPGVDGGGGGGTCAYGGYFKNYHDGWPNVWYEQCGVSKATVLSMQSFAVSGFRWCCDSCTPNHCLP